MKNIILQHKSERNSKIFLTEILKKQKELLKEFDLFLS
jgi:hypothetical protein